MSPLQYQKQLKLLEARRLMLAENFDAANAAYHVGYESPSQFTANTPECLVRRRSEILNVCVLPENFSITKGRLCKSAFE